MKTDLQELIDTAKKLSDRLDEASRQEREFCIDIQSQFEIMSWEMLRFSDDLIQIQQYVG